MQDINRIQYPPLEVICIDSKTLRAGHMSCPNQWGTLMPQGAMYQFGAGLPLFRSLSTFHWQLSTIHQLIRDKLVIPILENGINPFIAGSASDGKYAGFVSKLNNEVAPEDRDDYFSNTFIFRSYKNEKGRSVCYINKDLTPEFASELSKIFNFFLKSLKTRNVILAKDVAGKEDDKRVRSFTPSYSSPVNYRVITTGNPGKNALKRIKFEYKNKPGNKVFMAPFAESIHSTKSNALFHSNAKAMINIDIAKFYPSFNITNLQCTNMINDAVSFHSSVSALNLATYALQGNKYAFSEAGITNVNNIKNSLFCWLQNTVPDLKHVNPVSYACIPVISNPQKIILSPGRIVNDFRLNTAGRIEDGVEEATSTTESDVVDLMTKLLRFFTYNGSVPTGACYSPELTSYLFSHIDGKIRQIAYEHIVQEILLVNPDLLDGDRLNLTGLIRYAYNNKMVINITRYLDDITISTKYDGKVILDMNFIKKIEAVLNEYCLYLNYDKTKISGRKDKKAVTGIVLHEGWRPSVGSDYKFKVHKEVSGKFYEDLSAESIGKLAYIKSVNHKQFKFAISKIKFSKWLIIQSFGPADSEEEMARLLSILEKNGVDRYPTMYKHICLDWIRFLTGKKDGVNGLAVNPSPLIWDPLAAPLSVENVISRRDPDDSSSPNTPVLDTSQYVMHSPYLTLQQQYELLIQR